MKISRPLLAGCAAALLLSAAAATVAAQQGAKAPAAAAQQGAKAPATAAQQGAKAPATKAPATPSDVDPDALAALQKMSAALSARNTFVLNAETTTEDVLDSGEKLQFAGTLELQARRPDRFRYSAVSDLRDRQVYYDGKSVTVHAPKLGVYATFPAPSTIAQTLAVARERYDVELPLADLFTWGTDPADVAKLTSGFLVRPETIGGRSCNHYAFRQENVDWQIWIATAEPALPCKLVITNTDDDSRPQSTAVLRWSFPATIPENVFAFAAPASSSRIVIVDLESKQASGATR